VLNIYSSLVNAFDDNEVSILERMAKSISTAVKNIHIEIEKQKAQEQLNTSEANLKSIFDHTEVGYVLLDLNYTTISFNQALQNIFKFQNQNELKNGEHFLKNIGGEKSDHYSKIFTEVINNNSTIKYETKYLINNQEYYYYNVVVPVKSGDSIIGICLSKVDITNRKKEELLREKVTDELMQRNRDLEQFAYIISHNLRAPVANILGLNLLLNDHPNENDKNLIINKINKSANRLDEVIKDLNLILQVRRENSELKTDINFKQLIENVNESISSIINNNNVQFNLNFSEVETIHSIRTYLGSIFFNLITNSIKYAKINEQVIIDIATRKANNHILILYKDNGIGIDLVKYGDQIFGLYKKFNTSVEGKGIGLYMVKTQVEVLGGTISVQSEVNKGTSFTISFPIS